MDRVLKGIRVLFKGIANILICGLICFSLFPGFEIGDALCAESKIKLSDKEKKQLVERAVAEYETGSHAKAKELLLQAETAFPENYAVPYYLGLIYLEEGKRAAAISQWKRYVAMDANSENEVKIRKYLTMLMREQARDNAEKAVAQEAARMKGTVKAHAIAVTAFNDTGFEAFGPLGKGMAALLISDLSAVPGLEVVDRIELQMLLEEMKVGTFGQVDAASIPKVSKLLKVGHAVTGKLRNMETEMLQMTSTVFHTLPGTPSGSLKAEGELTQFHSLEKDIACQIVGDLGESCNKMPKTFHRVHTRSLPALVAYSWGLEYFDQENYDKAREMFQKALEEDPEFELAEAALLASPTSDMKIKSTPQMIADASSSGVFSAAAGSAVGGGNDRGFSKTTKIIGGIGGLAVIGGGIALAVGGGSGGGSDGPRGGDGGGGDGGGGDDGGDGPTPELKVSGVWRGNWSESGNDATFQLTIAKSDSASIIVNNSECIVKGEATVTISDPKVSLNIQSNTGNTFAWNGTCTQKDAENQCTEMNIDWQTETVNAPCVAGNGNFTTTKSGSTTITW